MDTIVPAAVLAYFDLGDAFPWRDPRPKQIEHRRARLLEAIDTSTYDALKRNCLVYFLLKWYQDGREERFKLEKCIPPQFASLSDAYWHLDAGTNILRAVSILADARLNTDYASKILQAISLAPQSTPLALKYVRTAKPVLTELDDIDIYIVALVESSLIEAWQFQRTFSEKNETRSFLSFFAKFIQMYAHCGMPTPPLPCGCLFHAVVAETPYLYLANPSTIYTSSDKHVLYSIAQARLPHPRAAWRIDFCACAVC
ncbi:Protein transport protein SEC24 [Mycena sanguinolenta]|uniref:Protein transport protein SEC24 n=1 Tax=Mycena sanguinolenta TaxID=230812 RepID=A0A8H6XZM1_9AGAR|nr:Protein transport protein SEC24 [Mycena sanguinolenta]